MMWGVFPDRLVDDLFFIAICELLCVSEGVAVERLVATMRKSGKQPDFVLCVGDDRSGEDMFKTIARSVANQLLPAIITEVFPCTVGQTPSMVKYYLDNTCEVIKMLQGLAVASRQLPKVAFEGFLSMK
ncbi:alpha,alpha-trehalose-phosphate synthase [UDP-forming] 5-like [Camellia sinensis]|uniref:alpha,alpha-trehalose-phosphate synthase [UDP-forming] 5-like n=1 Tax=Camellia sinensis TaxID=4442 RepID=UPI001036206D|nr:alpha,alpha-trehalose-phosphate synthase [UDP-forming] 5-like [Camellia sinensis]